MSTLNENYARLSQDPTKPYPPKNLGLSYGRGDPVVFHDLVDSSRNMKDMQPTKVSRHLGIKHHFSDLTLINKWYRCELTS